MDMPLTLFRLVGTTYKVVNKFDTRMKPRVCVARLVEFRGALEREWAGTQTQVRHEDENPNPNPNPNGSLKKTVGSFFYFALQRLECHIEQITKGRKVGLLRTSSFSFSAGSEKK